ncbi:uncharacterized protein N7473_007503 [Penicillium subrubescens]|uniref:Uncharacterized protein n=1 Tax=Penicillium subrubescens TaxID=1316194 RepID=A0A1Q5SSA8_9EURO|nr:uncharacterized protein N7473_007503 [Penicillium subrubescens]KAJ5891275.1 hypothetical protein N7473_007503 [Penicillium subrubescens]OKO90891.1 hypothetical protein PENSUB_13192 [Penicillium subrubescens]
MFSTGYWALLAVSCVLFASFPVHGQDLAIVERDANAGLEQLVDPDLRGAMLIARGSDNDGTDHTSRGPHTTTIVTTNPIETATMLVERRDVPDQSSHGPPPPIPPPTITITRTQPASTAICELATALCAACPPTVVTVSACPIPLATVTVTSCPFDTVTKTVTECFSTTTSTSTSSTRPASSSATATPTPSSSIRPSSSPSIIPSSSSVIPSSSSVRPSTGTGNSTSTTRSSTPMGPGFSSTIPPRTTSPTLSTQPTSTTASTARTTHEGEGGGPSTTRRGPPGIVRREMMGNITAIVTNMTRTFSNATTDPPLNLTETTVNITTNTTGVFLPRFHRARLRY